MDETAISAATGIKRGRIFMILSSTQVVFDAFGERRRSDPEAMNPVSHLVVLKRRKT
jgi:hypothetical protein